MNTALRIPVLAIVLALFVGCDHASDPGLKTDKRAVLERILPTSGRAGSRATIYGSALKTNEIASVKVGVKTATILTHAADSLDITIPSLTSGIHSVVLVLGEDTISSDLAFTVLKDAVLLERIAPSSGAPGSRATIYGSGFDLSINPIVMIGAESAVVENCTSISIDFVIPSIAAGSYPVLLLLGQDTISPNLNFVVFQPSVNFRTVTLSLTGVIGDIYNVDLSKNGDTTVSTDTLRPITMTLLKSLNCTKTGSKINFCFAYEYPGDCNCLNTITASGFMVLDTNAKLIKQIELKSDSEFWYGRSWTTSSSFSAMDLPYTQPDLEHLLVRLEGSQVADLVKSVSYRSEFWSTAAATSYFTWLNELQKFTSNAKLDILIGP